MTSKRLYRSRFERMIAGVAGGLANYFDIDPTIVRVLFVVSIFIGGGGIIAYIILWIVVPEEKIIYQSAQNSATDNNERKNSSSDFSTQNASSPGANIDEILNKAKSNKKYFLGGLLIFLGLLFLMDNIFPHFHFHAFWPLILIGLGIGIIMKAINN